MWKCKNCEEEVEDNFEVCWNCGSNKDGTKTESNNEFEKQKKDSASKHPISGSLKVIGALMKILGFVVAIYFLITFRGIDIFSYIFVPIIVIIFNYALGMICVGIAEILNLNYSAKN
ncbi:MAG: hypothetical protein GQ534_04375 [Candidatus Delongbacteria bacterium]|nr:hypothetical protein [Candidatus Delongbacteria bacterium]